MKIVKEDENVDAHGNPDMYEMDDKFKMALLADYVSEEEAATLLTNIPFSDKMAKFIIQWEKVR